MATVRGLATPAVLEWARKNAGFSVEDAARKARVPSERLLSWEDPTEDSLPTLRQLRLLARAYRRPLALFLLPEPPSEFQVMKDFRRLPDGDVPSSSPELLFEFRRAEFRRDVALEIEQGLGEEPEWHGVGVAVTLASDPERVGRAVRDRLGVTIEEQLDWTPGYETFNGWRNALEASGLLVFQMLEVEVAEARGFSIWHPELPTVAANIKDSLNARVFTLFHEVAHITLQDGGVCDPLAETGSDPAVEVFCNAVAGAALIPPAALRFVGATAPQSSWPDFRIEQFSRALGTSEEVVARRLLTLGLATPEFYRQKREQLIARFRELPPRRDEGYAPPAQLSVASNGPGFTRLLLDAFRQEIISGADLAEMLGVRLKHLARIETQVV